MAHSRHLTVFCAATPCCALETRASTCVPPAQDGLYGEGDSPLLFEPDQLDVVEGSPVATPVVKLGGAG
jgi:hypothetical protein